MDRIHPESTPPLLHLLDITYTPLSSPHIRPTTANTATINPSHNIMEEMKEVEGMKEVERTERIEYAELEKESRIKKVARDGTIGMAAVGLAVEVAGILLKKR